jgi:hypothetical protein
VDVLGAAQGEVQQTGADRCVGQPVDDDEAPHVAIVGVRIERDGAVKVEVADPDLIELEGLGGGVFDGIDVDAVFGVGDGDADGAGADLHQVAPAWQHVVVVHPDDVRLELVGDGRGRVGRGQDVASADVDLVGQGDRH